MVYQRGSSRQREGDRPIAVFKGRRIGRSIGHPARDRCSPRLKSSVLSEPQLGRSRRYRTPYLRRPRPRPQAYKSANAAVTYAHQANVAFPSQSEKNEWRIAAASDGPSSRTIVSIPHPQPSTSLSAYAAHTQPNSNRMMTVLIAGLLTRFSPSTRSCPIGNRKCSTHPSILRTRSFGPRLFCPQRRRR